MSLVKRTPKEDNSPQSVFTAEEIDERIKNNILLNKEPDVTILPTEQDLTHGNKTEAQESAVEKLIREVPQSPHKTLWHETRYDAAALIFRLYTSAEGCTGWDACSCGNEKILQPCTPLCKRCRCEVHRQIKFHWVQETQINNFRGQGYTFPPRGMVRDRIFDESLGAYIQKDLVLMCMRREDYSHVLKDEFLENKYKYDDKYRKQKQEEMLGDSNSAIIERPLSSENDQRGELGIMAKAAQRELTK
jgi:hypothetical protein